MPFIGMDFLFYSITKCLVNCIQSKNDKIFIKSAEEEVL
jgi:hypothetical protein